jgi:hypothetical protein
MRIERAAITFEPRTAANCLDLALKFAGMHIRELLLLWGMVALPSCLLVYMISAVFDLRAAAVIALFATYELGVCLSLMSLPAMFGAPFSFRSLTAGLRRHGKVLFGKGLLLRVAQLAGLALCVVPGAWLMFRTGFFVEKTWFAGEQSERESTRASRLVRAAGGEAAICRCARAPLCRTVPCWSSWYSSWSTTRPTSCSDFQFSSDALRSRCRWEKELAARVTIRPKCSRTCSISVTAIPAC